MRRIPFAAFAAAGMLAFPAFAQVPSAGTGTRVQGSARAGVSATGALSNTGAGSGGTDASAGTGATGASNLGLGGLLKQTQAVEPSTRLDGHAGQTGPSDAKAPVKKAGARGH